MNKTKVKELKVVAQQISRDTGLSLKKSLKLCKKQYLGRFK